MLALETDLRRRLLYILHRGFVEARLLALAKKDRQLFDLADALETIPGCLDQWRDDDLDSIRFNLRTYQRKYAPETFDYLAHLEDHPLPAGF